MEYYVYYERNDEDRILFVGKVSPTGDIPRNRISVHTGGQKECRMYVLENRVEGKAKSLRKVPPYNPL